MILLGCRPGDDEFADFVEDKFVHLLLSYYHYTAPLHVLKKYMPFLHPLSTFMYGGS